MFDADRPIQSSKDDRLNRTPFAKSLARCILEHGDKESLVIGLYGGFGAGKTSIINMALEELNTASNNMQDDEKPIILNFSPWSYSGQNDLIYSFFRRVSSAIRNAPDPGNKEKILYLLELYVSYFTHQPVPKSLQPKRSLFNKLFSKKNAGLGWESGRDLTVVKAELNALLSTQKHKIIIIIDNISRLYDIEIKQMFQCVKSIGDFANTIYLLSMDKQQVVTALDKMDSGTGTEFVEKIIQLPFEIPPILSHDLENILNHHLQESLKLTPIDSWDKDYWSDIYYSSFRYFFKNCRDITRYSNILNFSYYYLRNVVNPVDFFALSALAVFTPEIYIGIRDNKDLFTDLLDNVYVFDKQQAAKDKIRVDEILSRSNRLPYETLLQLLIKLFPRLQHIYQPNTPIHHAQSLARKAKRLCSPDLFDAYFRLSMQSSHIESNEFETLLSLAKDAITFDQALARLNQDNRIEQFLNMLDGPTLQKIPLENISSIIAALLDNGDLFPQGEDNLLSLSTPKRIHRIIHTLMQRYKTPEQRFLILENAITNATKSIFIIVNELREQSETEDQNSEKFLPAEFRDLTQEQLNQLKSLAVERIKYWAKDERLVDHPQLIPILFAFRDWDTTGNCSAYVRKLTSTDPGLVTFLTRALARAIAEVSTDYMLNPNWIIELNNINAFIPATDLKNHATQLFADTYFVKLRENEQLAILIFLDLLKVNAVKIISD